MSLFSSIGKAIRRGAKGLTLKKVVGAAASIALPGVAGIAAGGLMDGGSSSPARITSTAPRSTTVMNLPEPGFGGAIARALPGGDTGYLSRSKMKAGKLSGNPIPHGYHEKMSPQGMIYLVKSRRRRGITARDLQTYRRVHRTLKTYNKKFK